MTASPPGDETRPVLLVIACAGIVFPYLFCVWADADLWWHLKLGLEHLAGAELARVDTYSFVPTRNDWVNHAWLSELIFAWAYQAAGNFGLYLLRTALLCGIVAGLVFLYWSRCPHPLPVVVVTLFAIPYVSHFINVRSHSFTYLLVVVFLIILQLYRSGGKRIIWFMPMLMILWVNLHSGFVLGLGMAVVGLVLIMIGVETAAHRASGDNRRIMIALCLTIAATVFNPYGLELFRMVGRHVFSTGFPAELITEWRSLRGAQLLHYACFAAVPAVLWLMSDRRHKAEAVFFAGTAVYAYQHGRFFILLVVFGTLIMLEGVNFAWERYEAKGGGPLLERLDSKAALWVLLAAVVPASVARALPSIEQSGYLVRVDRAMYPVDAVRFLKRQDVGRHVASPLGWGGYLIWHLSEEHKVAVDGRNVTVYPEDYVSDYLHAFELGDLDVILRNGPVHVLIVRSESEMDATARRRPDWREIYRDAVAVVYVAADGNGESSSRPGYGTVVAATDDDEPVFFP